MEEEYLNLLRLFRAEDVEYVVVGGYAVIAHGFPRTTGDLDVLVRPTPANARRVVRALARFGYENRANAPKSAFFKSFSDRFICFSGHF